VCVCIDGITVLFPWWFLKCKTTLSAIIEVGLHLDILINEDDFSFTNWTSDGFSLGKSIQDFVNHFGSQGLHFFSCLPKIAYMKSWRSHYKCSLSNHEMLHFLIVKTEIKSKKNCTHVKLIDDVGRKMLV
jgi:hypothetical protein